jgi:hypothetical protein
MIEVERLRMAVMMQAFYWVAPIRENKRGEWWNFLAETVSGCSQSIGTRNKMVVSSHRS